MKLFKAVDVFGKDVELTLERYEHMVSAHPEMEGKQKEMQGVLQNPDFVKESRFDSKTRLFYKRVKKNEYHTIVVKYKKESNFVLTGYFAERVKRGDTVWRR